MTHTIYELWHLWIWWWQIRLAEWQRMLYLSQPVLNVKG